MDCSVRSPLQDHIITSVVSIIFWSLGYYLRLLKKKITFDMLKRTPRATFLTSQVTLSDLCSARYRPRSNSTGQFSRHIRAVMSQNCVVAVGHFIIYTNLFFFFSSNSSSKLGDIYIHTYIYNHDSTYIYIYIPLYIPPNFDDEFNLNHEEKKKKRFVYRYTVGGIGGIRGIGSIGYKKRYIHIYIYYIYTTYTIYIV